MAPKRKETYVDDGFIVDDSKPKAKSAKRAPPQELKGQNGGYAWEDEYRRSWDIVQEDEEGSIATSVKGLVDVQRRRRAAQNHIALQRGIIRAVVLIIDYSQAMVEKDLRPNRAQMVINYAKDFVTEFFDQNPISQLAIVMMRNGLGIVVSDISGDVQHHLESLRKITRVDPEGGPSLQNGLELARGLLLHVGGQCMREVVMVYGGLSTTDPGNIHTTVKALAHDDLSVRIVGLTARVAVCDEICKATGGQYAVALDETHLKQLMMDWVVPMAISIDKASAIMVIMGFPQRIRASTEPQLCGCHSRLQKEGYICPQCKTLVCSVPLQCPCCSLTLVLSTHLARSYHHLFPLEAFKDIEGDAPCSVCAEAASSQCSKCHGALCSECALFAQDVLHNCPACESQLSTSPS